MPSDNVLSHIFYTRFILSTRSLEKSTLWRSDDVSQIPRQVAGTPRPPSPLRKVHSVSAFVTRSAFFSLRLASYSSLVRRAIRPVPGIILGAYYGAGSMVPTSIVLLVING